MEKSEFLGFFYRHCVHVLVAPIYACTSTGKLSGKGIANIYLAGNFCLWYEYYCFQQIYQVSRIFSKVTLHTLQHNPIHWSFICLDDYKRATTLDHIVDLLTFCVLHHNYNMRSYLLGKDLIKRVHVLLQSRHKFLALGRQVWILRYTLT